MRIYLAHANADLSSERDGYVMGLREAEHDAMLYSFAYCFHFQLPIKPLEERLRDYENLLGQR